MDHITITVNGAVVYDSELQIARTPLPEPKPSEPDSSNPFVAWKAQKLSIYDIIAPAMLARALTPAELEQAKAAGYDVSDFAPGATLTPDGFDPYRTSLTAEDAGKVFKARPGRTHYSYPGTVQWRTVLDGEDHVDAKCSVSLNGGSWFDARGAMGPIGDGSTLDIDCNYEWSVQIS